MAEHSVLSQPSPWASQIFARCPASDRRCRSSRRSGGWLSRRQRRGFPPGKRREEITAASRFLRLTGPFRDRSIQIRFIAPLKSSFKSPVDHRVARERPTARAGGAQREENRVLMGQGKATWLVMNS